MKMHCLLALASNRRPHYIDALRQGPKCPRPSREFNQFSRHNYLFITTMKMAKSCMATNQRRSGSEGHRFETRCQQGLFFHCGISGKIYPSSCDLYTHYQFMCETYWLNVHLLFM